MVERKYSIGEIDRMRNALSVLCDTGFAFARMDRNAGIEQKLRTYMQNGTEPDELEKLAGEKLSLQQKMCG
jgi:hypothetical protein